MQTIDEYIQEQMIKEFERYIDIHSIVAHEMMWGVPCGPTLGMVQRKEFTGLFTQPKE